MEEFGLGDVDDLEGEMKYFNSQSHILTYCINNMQQILLTFLHLLYIWLHILTLVAVILLSSQFVTLDIEYHVPPGHVIMQWWEWFLAFYCVTATDASDWDSASTASKRTLPGCRMVSPGFGEHPECSTPSVQEEEISSAAPLTTHKHMDSGKGLTSTPPQTVPHPQPRTRKMFPQKQESDDGRAIWSFLTYVLHILVILCLLSNSFCSSHGLFVCFKAYRPALIITI